MIAGTKVDKVLRCARNILKTETQGMPFLNKTTWNHLQMCPKVCCEKKNSGLKYVVAYF